MKEIEILTAEIIQQMAEDGTPVTNEEAAEMAKMEINSRQINRYTSSGNKKVSRKPRKIDPDKLFLIQILDDSLCDVADNVQERKNESEINFIYNENFYTVKLIKHRPKQ